MRPEQKLSDELKKLMEADGWLLEKSFGNAYQSGWPDFYCAHPIHGVRWIEMKSKTGRLTQAQSVVFPRWTSYGVGIWIIDHINQYPKSLFEPPNWERYKHKVRYNSRLGEFLGKNLTKDNQLKDNLLKTMFKPTRKRKP